MRLVLLTTTLLLAQDGVSAFFKNLYKDTRKLEKPLAGSNAGNPLILTPYLEDGRIEEAQQAALVQHPDLLGLTSYAGYFTVDKQFDSNLWFWFFPSADTVEQDPVVVWLNGGPGATSLNGLFDENGPYIVNANFSISARPYSWHKNQNIIFFDQPVGTGFSYTNGGLAENMTKVGDDMRSAITQFFTMFPNLQSNPFYISGESYAGKFVPAIGYSILKHNPDADLKINLQGLLIGDGWTDPIHQTGYGPYVYNVGLVSEEVKEAIDKRSELVIENIKKGNMDEAADHQNNILGLIANNAQVNMYNYMEDYDDSDAWIDYVTSDEIREVIHVGNTEFGDKGVSEALRPDNMLSIAPWIEEMLESIRILVYTGQGDVMCGYPMSHDYVVKLNFSGTAEYHNASRKIWYVGDEPAGYFRQGGNLVELLVRNAGHLLPRDQPRPAYEMLYTFIRNNPFDS